MRFFCFLIYRVSLDYKEQLVLVDLKEIEDRKEMPDHLDNQVPMGHL